MSGGAGTQVIWESCLGAAKGAETVLGDPRAKREKAQAIPSGSLH